MTAAPFAGEAVAQSAAPAADAAKPGNTVQLPEVTVTTASPVAKPHKAKKKTTGSGAAGAPSTAAIAAPVPVIPPLPGTIVSDDAFVAVTVATSREIQATAGQTITDTLMNK